MLHKALRIVRTFEGMTQTQAANRLGISQSYISEIERGDKIPTLEIIGKYSEVFGIPISAIMLFSENMQNNTSSEKARTLVAGKVIELMEFIERRSHRADAE